jgi:acetolactate synthase I/II/III large subunit
MKTVVALPGERNGLEVIDATSELMSAAGMPVKSLTPQQVETGRLNLMAGATKYTVAATEPKQAVQTVQPAIKHATTLTPGPVAVVFASRSLAGTVKSRRPPRLHETRRLLAHWTSRPASDDVTRAADALLAAGSPVIIAGNGVHASRAWSELAELADLLSIPVATTATGKSAMAEVHPLALGVFGYWGCAIGLPGRPGAAGVRV